VDDDAAVLKSTCRLLKVAGFRVSTALSLSEAVRLAREHDDIELLITDFHLGNGELGTDVIEVIRGNVGPRLRTVLLSGDTSSALKKTIRDDAIRLVSKPVRAEELLGLLGSLAQH
jgi:CheY-like chemotaxis protein